MSLARSTKHIYYSDDTGFLHYAHTFEICTFHFQIPYQSHPKESMYPRNGLNSIMIYSRMLDLKTLLLVVVQFRQAHRKNQERYGDESFQDRWCKSIFTILSTKNIPRKHIMIGTNKVS